MAGAQHGNADFVVGKPVEITRGERRRLEEAAQRMKSAAYHGRRGWFLEYLQAHRDAHRTLRRIFQRSHAS